MSPELLRLTSFTPDDDDGGGVEDKLGKLEDSLEDESGDDSFSSLALVEVAIITCLVASASS